MAVVGKKMAKGAAWMVLFKFADRGLGLVTLIILARLLLPEDFGLIAMAMSLIAMVELLHAFGFDMALIHNQSAERRHFDTAWTFDVIFATVSAVLLVVLALPAAEFYREDRLAPIIYALAFGSFVQGLENIGVVEFRRQLNFDKEFKFLLAKRLASFFITVPLALVWRDYWALVVGMVAGKLIGLIMSYWMHPYRPRLSLQAARELFRFSSWLLLNNLLFFAKNRSTELIIGRQLGPTQLGVYTLSNEIANLPTTELIAPINRAVYPGYAKVSGEVAQLQQNFLNVLGLIIVFALPAGLGIALTADLIVPLFLGDQWSATIPVISILALYGAVSALQSNITYVFLAIGKPKIETFLGIAYVIILISLLLTLIPAQGVVGAAWAYLITVGIITIPTLLAIRHELGLHARQFLDILWRPLLAGAAMYWALEVTMPAIRAGWPDMPVALALAAAVLTGASTYGGALLGLWALARQPDGAELELLKLVRSRLGLSTPESTTDSAG